MQQPAGAQVASRCALLRAFIIRRQARGFAWGISDCCTFAMDATYVQSGQDLMRDLRGTYFSARSAARLLAQHGGLVQLADARFAHRLEPHQVAEGDVGLVIDPRRREDGARIGALGVAFCGVCVAQGAAHLVARPVAEVAVWWRPVAWPA